MSATLTWYNSGLGTKLGTAIGNFFTDFKTLVDSKAADPNFSWEISASSLAGTPYYLWFRPKSGAAGRILLISWSSAPAGNNAAILDGAPVTTVVYVAYFPAGTAASPSNLTASSGTISGDDTNCVKCGTWGAVATLYGASIQPYYFDSTEALVFCTGNPSSAGSQFFTAVGQIVVDANDVAYGATYGTNQTTLSAYGSTTGPLPWATSGLSAGAAGVGIKSNYASQAVVGSIYPTWYPVWAPSGPWTTQTYGAVTDVLTDTTNTDVWFVPNVLMSCGTKGGGFPLKLRQIAFGPSSQGQFTVYNTAGPVTQVRNMSCATAPGTGYPWLTNFKI